MRKVATYTFAGLTAIAAFFGLRGAQPAPLQIVTTSFNTGEVNKPYSTPISATGGKTPYTWSAMTLPQGFSISGSSISGTTPTAYASKLTISVRDKNGRTASTSLPLLICYPVTVYPQNVKVETGKQIQFQAFGGIGSIDPPVCNDPPPNL